MILKYVKDKPYEWNGRVAELVKTTTDSVLKKNKGLKTLLKKKNMIKEKNMIILI